MSGCFFIKIILQLAKFPLRASSFILQYEIDNSILYILNPKITKSCASTMTSRNRLTANNKTNPCANLNLWCKYDFYYARNFL